MEQPSSYPLSVSALAPPPHSTVATVSSAEPTISVGREGGQRPADTTSRIGLESEERSTGIKEREHGGSGRQLLGIEEKRNSYKLPVDLPTRTNMVTHITTMPTAVSTIVTSTSETTTTTTTSTSPESIESSPLPAASNSRPLSLDHLWKSVNKDEERNSSESDGRREQDDKKWEREREQKLALKKEREKEEKERVRRELQLLQHDASPVQSLTSSKQYVVHTINSLQ